MNRYPRYVGRFGLWTACVLVVAQSTLAADRGPAARLSFADGTAELATLTEQAELYSGRVGSMTVFPDEMRGLTFARRPYDKPTTLTVDADAGATVYLMIGRASPASAGRGAAVAAGWVEIGHARWSDHGDWSHVVYRRAFDAATRAKIPVGAFTGVIVVGEHLALNPPAEAAAHPPAAGHRGDAQPRADPIPDADPSGGPTVKAALAQTSINALEIDELPSGLMLGETSEVVLTVTRDAAAKRVTVKFATAVGPQMRLACDDALRFIHVQYPNWYAGPAEITFEDKYVAHDGGSIGAAIGTLVLSAIQGFQIDPAAAMTGDVSANGKIGAIGGVAAKLRGAVASHCRLVALPMANLPQFADAVTYDGPAAAVDVQVIGIATLADAVAAVRVDRDAKLGRAIDAFDAVRAEVRKSAAYLKRPEAVARLTEVLTLAPNHLSARVLLAVANGTAAKTLSPTATRYYSFLAGRNMLDVLAKRSAAPHPVSSGLVRSGLADLRKLRPLADPTVRPLVDAWARFVEAVESFEQHGGSRGTLERQRQALLDEMAKEQADPKLMQQMLKEGM